MKDILIISNPTSRESIFQYQIISKELLLNKEGVQQILETAWLLTGPKSFEIATDFRGKTFEKNIPSAAFEIESVLFGPKENLLDNR